LLGLLLLLLLPRTCCGCAAASKAAYRATHHGSGGAILVHVAWMLACRASNLVCSFRGGCGTWPLAPYC
jgi:hypothetical protein